MSLKKRPWPIALSLSALCLAAWVAVVGAQEIKPVAVKPTGVPPAEVQPAGKPDAGKPDASKPDAGKPDTVRVSIQTIPSRKARVKWGKKNLGVIPAPKPLIILRPRDSGPMDIVVRADGYLPVRTRANTFTDVRMSVKLTPVDQKNTLFGYRTELPPPNPDGGVPPETGAPIIPLKSIDAGAPVNPR